MLLEILETLKSYEANLNIIQNHFGTFGSITWCPTLASNYFKVALPVIEKKMAISTATAESITSIQQNPKDMYAIFIQMKNYFEILHKRYRIMVNKTS